MNPTNAQATQTAELARLRRELLRKIVENEFRRRHKKGPGAVLVAFPGTALVLGGQPMPEISRRA